MCAEEDAEIAGVLRTRFVWMVAITGACVIHTVAERLSPTIFLHFLTQILHTPGQVPTSSFFGVSHGHVSPFRNSSTMPGGWPSSTAHPSGKQLGALVAERCTGVSADTESEDSVAMARWVQYLCSGAECEDH